MSPRGHPAYFRTSPLIRFGDRIRALRTARGWSQEELAHRAGRHWTFASQIERGERNPTLITILQLAEALEIDPGDLITLRTVVAEKVAEVAPVKARRRSPSRRR